MLLVSFLAVSVANGQVATGNYLNLSFRGDGSTPSALDGYEAMSRSAAAPSLALSASEKGEVSFSQPLSLPPARLQPSVSLGYGAGGSVHSWLGRGWSLSTGLTLTRPQRGGERAYLDGSFTAALMVSGDGLSGLLRFDGVEWVWTSPSPGVVKATELADGSFEVRSGARTWILEETLAGTWRSTVVTDRDGNRIDYTWTGSRLDNIEYGGSATQAHHVLIDFIYGSTCNPPSTWSAASGELEEIDERLEVVSVRTSAVAGGFALERREYALNYEEGGEFLTQIVEAGVGSSDARVLAHFEYSDLELELTEGLAQNGEAPWMIDSSRTHLEEVSPGDYSAVSVSEAGLYDLTFDGRPDTVLGGFYVDPQLTRPDQRSYFYTQQNDLFYDCDGGVVDPADGPVDPSLTYDGLSPVSDDLGTTYAMEHAGATTPGASSNVGFNETYATKRYIDVDSDGILDLVLSDATPASGLPPAAGQFQWDVCYGTKSGFEPCVSETAPYPFPRKGQSPVLGPSNVSSWQPFAVHTVDSQVDLLDIDQDGWVDVLTIDSNGDWIVYYKEPGRGLGWQTQDSYVALTAGPHGMQISEASAEELFLPLDEGSIVTPVIEATRTVTSVQDINGDGVADLIEVDNQGDWQVYAGNGHGFEEVPVPWASPLPYLGYSDEGRPTVTVVSLYDAGIQQPDPQALQQLLDDNFFIGQIAGNQTGASYRDPLAQIGTASASTQWGEAQYVIVGLLDMDGDGLADLFDGFNEVWYRNLGDGFEVWGEAIPTAWPRAEGDDNTEFAFISRAFSFSVAGDTSADPDVPFPSFPSLEDTTPSVSFTQILARDMNGDRLPDIVIGNEETYPHEEITDWERGIAYMGNATPQIPAGLLTTVINGQGLRTDITYEQSTSMWPSGTTYCQSVDAELARPLVASITALDPFEDSIWVRQFDYGESYCDMGVCWGFFDVMTTDFTFDGDWRGSQTYTEYNPFWVDGPRMDFQVIQEASGSPYFPLPEGERWRTTVGYNGVGWPVSRTLVETRDGLTRNTYGSISYDTAGNPTQVVVDGDSSADRIETHTTWLSDVDGVLWVPQERWTRAWHWPDQAMRTVERGRFAYDGGVVGDAPTLGHMTWQEVDAGAPGSGLGSETLVWSFARDARGNVSSATDPMGNVQTWTWDLFGGSQWSVHTNAMGWVMEQEVDLEGRVDATVNENGERTDTTFDGLGRVATVSTTGAQTTLKLLRSSTSYVEAFVDPATPYTEWEPAYAHKITTLYDGEGLATGEQVETYTVSDAGTGEGAVVWTTHEDGGYRIQFVDDGILGQPLYSGGQVTSEAFDPTLRGGQVDQSSQYDGLGEPILRWSRDAGDTVISYPEPGVVQEVQDAAQGGDPFYCSVDRTKRLTSDIHGRLVKVEEGEEVGALATTGQYRYDGRARIARFDDANGNRHDYRFDGAGRLRQVWRAGPSDPLEHWVQYDYDLPFPGALGAGAWPTRMAIGDQASPDVTTWTYDELGRTVEKVLEQGHGGGTDTFTWAWDGAWKGARDSITFPIPSGEGKVEYDYASSGIGDRGLVASETRLDNGGARWTISYTHDGQGQVESTTYPRPLLGTMAGPTVTNDYHANGTLDAQVLTSPSGATTGAWSYSHNRWGSTESWSGTASGTFVSADIVRGGPNRYARMAWVFPGNTLSVDYDYCGDDGRLELREYQTTVSGVKRFWYDYDHLDRITGVSFFGAPTEAYGYDDAGNITQMHLLGSVPGPMYGQGWNYSTAPRFGQIPARETNTGVVEQFFYDDVGRLQLRSMAPGTPNAEISEYVYDSASRLIEVSHSDGSGVVLWYDNDDQVVFEERVDAAGAPENVERFGPYQERAGMQYTRVLPHVTLEGTGQLRYILGEPDGRAAWVLDAGGGLVSEQVSTVYGLEYDSAVWGAAVNTAGKWPLGGLHGAESDVSTGVMQFGARHVTNRGDGMWMQPEPLLALGMAGGFGNPRGFGNIYSAGNTNLYQDPDGYFVESGWDALNVGVGLVSLASNLSEGNYGAAAVDAVGVVIDGAATVVPGVPGGAGTAIKVARGADKAVDVIKGVNHGGDVLRGVDKATDAVKVADDVPTVAPCSFTEGTTIVTPSGQVPVEEVRAGDVVLATADPRDGATDWLPVPQGGPEGACARIARVGRQAVLPALLAACAPADAATVPPSALTQVRVYDAATSTWRDAPFGSVRVGDELHYGEHLLEVTAEGLLDRGGVAIGKLEEASRHWTVRTEIESPAHGDWVLVLGDGAYHASLGEALASDVRFVHRGHVFESVSEGGTAFVRWNGDVLARSAGGMVRTADGVFDLVIEGEAGRHTLEVTPEHPFWVAGTGWLVVDDLVAGDLLRTLDGSEARVVEKAWRPGDVEVFNVAVEGAHTYFVGGWTPVLAHNCDVSALRPTQPAVSGPKVDRLAADMAENGFDAASPIKVDGDLVVEGHHRVMAAKEAKVDIVTTPGKASTAQKAEALESFDDIEIDPVDWGD